MPPLPKSSPRSEERPGQPSSSGTEERPRARTQRSSSAASSSPRGRITKLDTLQHKLELMYKMIGTMIRPFSRFYPKLEPIGDNFQALAPDAAEAWIELAQQDARVKDILESITGASTWGNVLGIHLAIFASALPGQEYISQVNQQMEEQMSPGVDDVVARARAMGLSEQDIAEARKLAEEVMGSGGPGDTIRTGGIPEPPVQTTSQNSGIVTPEELGVTQAGVDGTFPADTTPPNGR